MVKHHFIITVIIIAILAQLNCKSGSIPESGSDGTKGMSYKVLGEISDLFKAPRIVVDESNFYVWDKFLCKVRIYSKKDLKRIGGFGKRGSGPEEFRVIHNVAVDKDYIYVSAYPKLSVFTKDGKFVKEMKGTTVAGSFISFGKNFVGRRHIMIGKNSPKSKMRWELYDSSLNKIRDIFETEFNTELIRLDNVRKKFLWYRDCYRAIVYKDRLYIGTTDRGYYIAVFDTEGNKLYEIDKKYNRRKVKKENIETFKNKFLKVTMGSRYEEYAATTELIFPEYYPAFVNFKVDSDRIYVFKYPERLSPIMDVDILDLEGKLIKKEALHVMFWKSILFDEYYFFGGKFFKVEWAKRYSDDLYIVEIPVEGQSGNSSPVR